MFLYSISLRRSFINRKCFEYGLVFLKKQLFNKNSTKFLDNLSPWDYFSVVAKGETLFAGGSLKILEIFDVVSLSIYQILIENLKENLTSFLSI